MTNEEFDAMVELMQSIAYRAAGAAIHQQRAGSIEDDIEQAREICVPDEFDPEGDNELAKAALGVMAND